MRVSLIITIVLLTFLTCLSAFAECRQFVQLCSAREVAYEMGATEQWVVANYKIEVWAKTTEQGKGRAVGSMLPGSRALLLAVSPRDYKIKSPLDGSVGWVNVIQVQGVLMQDDKTFQPCR